MCQETIHLNKTKEGQLVKCNQCQLYNLTFNNIMLEFNEKEFESFQNYLQNIEIDYWEERYSGNTYTRKVPIQTVQQNLFLIFTRHEIECLKKLVLLNKEYSFQYLKFKNIDYNLFLN